MPIHKKQYHRSLNEIMQSEYVRLRDEAPQRYPLAYSTLMGYKSERRINTYGSPAMIHCPEFEAQMKAGFPVIEGANAGLAQKSS